VRSRGIGLATALVLLVAGGGAVVWARHDLDVTRQDPPASSVPDGTPIVPGTIVHVESDVRATTFLPLGSAPDDGRTLSGQHAYNALVQDASKLNPIPATVRAYYGVLTDARTSPPAVHLRVWAFAVTSGCVTSGGVPAPGDPTPSPPPQRQCRLWEFVNARSGQALGVMSQEVLPD
jgi:NAD(P)-dependent dehydrogenase (short-subunit alcohol dehydrogenase family)